MPTYLYGTTGGAKQLDSPMYLYGQTTPAPASPKPVYLFGTTGGTKQLGSPSYIFGETSAPNVEYDQGEDYDAGDPSTWDPPGTTQESPPASPPGLTQPSHENLPGGGQRKAFVVAKPEDAHASDVRINEDDEKIFDIGHAEEFSVDVIPGRVIRVQARARNSQGNSNWTSPIEIEVEESESPVRPFFRGPNGGIMRTANGEFATNKDPEPEAHPELITYDALSDSDTIDIPLGVLAGDLVVAIATCRGMTGSTEFDGPFTTDDSHTSDLLDVAVGSYVSDGVNDPASVTFTGSFTDLTMSIYVLRNAAWQAITFGDEGSNVSTAALPASAPNAGPLVAIYALARYAGSSAFDPDVNWNAGGADTLSEIIATLGTGSFTGNTLAVAHVDNFATAGEINETTVAFPETNRARLYRLVFSPI